MLSSREQLGKWKRLSGIGASLLLFLRITNKTTLCQLLKICKATRPGLTMSSSTMVPRMILLAYVGNAVITPDGVVGKVVETGPTWSIVSTILNPDNAMGVKVSRTSDGQHSAAYIAEMVHVAEEKGANIVIGSRFATQKKPVSARMAGSVLISAMIMLTTRKRIQDPTSGMRLFDKQMIPLFANELDFGPEPDTISLLMRWGYKVKEKQVEMRERVAGESYLNFTKSVAYMLRMSISILLVQWFRRKK